MAERERVLIVGAGGRDFHVFNTCFRNDPETEVVAFTAAQIPHIDQRTYPPVLAGAGHPAGIPIVPESRLLDLIRERAVARVVFAYSDVTRAQVDELGARVRAAGARFETFDPDRTMLLSSKPVVAVCAVRTGCGKSATSRFVVRTLGELGLRAAVLRHPMPYGQLQAQVWQRFATLDDLRRHDCTIEEMEEYEPHLAAGSVVFAGADYARILAEAEREADVIVWDGGNNDLPFLRPDLHVVLLDPLRAGDELRYFPSRENLERADVLVVVKTDVATPAGIAEVEANARAHNPRAVIVHSRSPIRLAAPELVAGKRALVVEDGPTTTHGGMAYGAGLLAARAAGAAEIVDPRPFAVGAIAAAYARYPHLEAVVPALGYSAEDVAELERTIAAADCDVVVVGTPIDLTRIVRIDKPAVRAEYRYEEASDPGLGAILRERFAARVPRP
ncbi:MAG: GTPase [Planctomycetes bacterium]|nr:GTPase [Planctomycetota bacterium]